MSANDFAQRAQTNIQLYNQLSESRFSTVDLLCIQRAYTTAAEIFAGQVRPEGRPFICHLVGVASILAQLGEAVPVICAGLLHSAFSQGDFGAGKGNINGSARRRLESSVGHDTQELIDGYGQCAWNATNVCHWTVNAGNVDRTLRTVILIRLADALEDALDFGLQFSTKGEKHANAIPREDIVALAGALKYERLAAALGTTYEDQGRKEIFELLREERDGSVVNAPKSYRAKLLPLASRTLRMLAAKVLTRLYYLRR